MTTFCRDNELGDLRSRIEAVPAQGLGLDEPYRSALTLLASNDDLALDSAVVERLPLA